LTQVNQIRSLSQERARGSVPVRIRGVVTAFSGYKNSFFIRDSRAGISVDRTDNAEVHVGDEVEVNGTSSAGFFAPLVMASRVRVIGQSAPPTAHPVTYGDLFGGAQDSQWIEVKGVVHSAVMTRLFDRDTVLLSLELGGGSVGVLLQDFAGLDYGGLVDATVLVRGVCSTSFNEKRQFVGVGMFVPNRRDIDVLNPAPRDPFSVMAVPVSNVLQFGQGSHRVKVAGIVTYQIPGSAIYLQNGNDGIRVLTNSKVLAQPGTIIEAVGFPAKGDYAPILEDSFVRTVGHSTPIVPLRIEAAKAINSRAAFTHVPYDEQLVQLRGNVVESHIQGGERVWILRQDGQTFEAHLALSPADDAATNIDEGSILMLTGICTVHAGSGVNPISFGILLRSPQDILIIKHPPWWTPAHALLLLSVLAGGMIVVILWVVILRKRVEQQTRIIRESEARFRDLAQHDGLTGLLNRNAILSVLDIEMERARREKNPIVIVLADIDHFKRVNDTHGHLAGDEALRRFAGEVAAQVRSYDHVGRYGGEEFLLVLWGIPQRDVEERLASLHSRISNLLVEDRGSKFNITCSMGAIFVDPDEDGSGQQLILAAADHALYEAKDSGRNRVVYRGLATEMAAPKPLSA
jgi:diguanylate cyclase (GGDEF)-like protein